MIVECLFETVLFVMYGRRFFYRVLAITERSEVGLYEVPMFLSSLGLSMGIMFANIHVCEMICCLMQCCTWYRVI